jgi:transcription termination factor Rho
VPKSTWSESVLGVTVTTPNGADTVLFSSIASAFSRTSPETELMVPELVIELP